MVYINSIGQIFPVAGQEPDYKTLINPVQLRRMSRILKLGLGASQLCIRAAGNPVPDAIIVGTGLACINDLETFLKSVLNENEHALSPIPFINSSHNTVAAQISRILKNRSYNNTFCHRGTAFESALQDAMMMIDSGEARNALLGGIDEYSENYRKLLQYISPNTLQMTNMGEGTAFFMLSNIPDERYYAKIRGVKTAYFPNIKYKEAEEFLRDFLNEIDVAVSNIDTVVLGRNGSDDDEIYDYVQQTIFSEKVQFVKYKHLCGEFPTSGSFALALIAEAMKNGKFPESCLINPVKKQVPCKTLIFNYYLKQNFSLILLDR